MLTGTLSGWKTERWFKTVAHLSFGSFHQIGGECVSVCMGKADRDGALRGQWVCIATSLQHAMGGWLLKSLGFLKLFVEKVKINK